MTIKTPPEYPNTFAGRKAEREAREAAEGPPPRRQFANAADRSSEFTIGNVTVRRVQR